MKRYLVSGYLLLSLLFLYAHGQSELVYSEEEDLENQIEQLTVDEMFDEINFRKYEPFIEQDLTVLMDNEELIQDGMNTPQVQEENTLLIADEKDCPLDNRTIQDFNDKYFWRRPQCEFSKVQIGLDDLQGRLMAIGFINNDPKPQKIDLVTVNDEMNAFRVHVFDAISQKYKTYKWHKIDGESAYVSSIQIAKDQTILRSLIVTYWKTKPTTGKEDTFVKVFKQVTLGEFESNPSDSNLNGLELNGNIQPFWFDINGDMVNDFIYQETPSKIKVALGKSKDTSQFEFKDFSDFVISSAEDKNCLDFNAEDLISTPHSNSYVDLNQDCVPDIFLTRIDQSTQELYYEVYIQKFVEKKQRYCLVKTKQMLTREDFPAKKGEHKQVPLIYFTDIDGDSQIDMIFYYEGHIFSFFNQMAAKNFNSKDINTEQNLCHKQEQSTVSLESNIFQDITKYKLQELKDGGDKYLQVQNIQDIIIDKNLEILDIADPLSDNPMQEQSNKISQGRIRLEDMDLNGLPDILISLLVNNKTSGKKMYYPTLLSNKAMSNQDCQKAKGKQCRKFTESTDYKEVRKIAGQTSSLLVPIDVDENGKLDFFSQHVISGKKNGYKLIYNNHRQHQDDQNFFLKMMILFDHTTSSDFVKSESSDKNIGKTQQDIYGDIISGATLRFVASKLDYEKYVKAGSQQNQMTYNSFMMPYIYIGVSDTSNYFESISIGTSINGESKIFLNTPVIPKSQLILFANDKDTLEWTWIMFTDPGIKMYYILVYCGVFLFILGIIILVKYFEEKREDEKMRPIFNFDYF